MKGIVSKVIMLFVYLYYGAILYTAWINPSHGYMNYLENATTLYLFIHIPLNFLLGILALALVFQKKQITVKVKEEIAKSDEKILKKLKTEGLKFTSKKTRFLLGLSRFVSMLVTVTVFVMFNWTFLGFVMLVGTFSGGAVLNYCTDFYEEALNA